MGLILPGDPLFDLTLSTSLPPGWREHVATHEDHYAFVASADTGVLRVASPTELTEYVYGGEYEARLETLGGSDSLNGGF